jgi:putative ABC transport system permease protein
MRAINRKLLRNLWAQRGPVLAIALILGSGLAVLVMSLSVVDSLRETRRAYYERYRFADVFATAVRAPEELGDRIARIDGVGSVETRINKTVVLDIDGFEEPATARLISLPDTGRPHLNGLAMRSGRLPEPGATDEAIVLDSLAGGHGLQVRDTISAIMDRKKRRLKIVGIALSPEFVYAIGPGSLMPDEKRFGVIWMRREALAGAFDLDGAFNDVVIGLMRGGDPALVIDEVDRLLDRYGGIGAVDRSDQISNWFVSNEIDQLNTLATVLPVIFLGVAAFVMNVVISRLVALERGQIGLLKAFGYGPFEIGRHYTGFVLVTAVIGIVLGGFAGFLFGRQMTEVYADQFRFPLLVYTPSFEAIGIAALAGITAAVLGGLGAIRSAIALPPAEAMRPSGPTAYRSSPLTAMTATLDQPTRMVLRHLTNRPARTATAITGISLALGVLIMSLSWRDSIEEIVVVFFQHMQSQDVTVTLTESAAPSALHALSRLPGALVVEPFRAVPVRLRVGTKTYLESAMGLPPEPSLFRPLDAEGRPVALPERGLVISSKLAERLGVVTGDRITVEARSDRRPVAELPVVGVIETLIGTPVYMSRAALDRFMRDGERISGAYMRIDTAKADAFFAYLKRTPDVASISSKLAALGEFRRTLDETMDIIVSVYVAFGCAMAFGVVYNAARVSLSERARDLASLRVLGFTPGEVSYVLLAELAIVSALALPLGCVAGYFLKLLFISRFDNDLFRVPMEIEPSSYGTGMLIGLAAIALSGLIVRRKIDGLDMITVLKTRE